MTLNKGREHKKVLLAILCAVWPCACARTRNPLDTFRTDDRFRLELYASEPLLDGPVAMAFDDQGRALVLEMPAFPPDPSEVGRVKLIEDVDRDGKPDRATLVPPAVRLPARIGQWREELDRTTDPQGHRFNTSAACHVQYEVAASVFQPIPDHGCSALIFPITENPIYPVSAVSDHTISTCGIAFYSSRSVPAFERVLFMGEPVHNLVHCDLLTEADSNFVARRARDQSEFLASTDPWFRPVGFSIGPDDALYVVDFYAPLVAPAEVLEVGIKPDSPLFRSVGKGRIYRLTPRTDIRNQVSNVRSEPSDLGPPKADLSPRASDGASVEQAADIVPYNRAQLEKIISDPREQEPVQAAAVRTLGNIPGERPGLFLLSRWRLMTGAPRSEAMEALFRETSRLRALLTALEKEEIPLWCVDTAHRIRLLRHKDPDLAGRIRRLLEAHDPSRNPVVKNYEAALTARGNKEAGELVYKRLCGRCHTFRGGSNYGPDLWTVSSRPPRHILIDILLPSESMAPGREMYMIDLRGGGSVDGVIASQDSTTLRVLHDESRQETVLREDIQRILLSDSSAMPVELASQVSVRDMADLLRFLTSR